MPYEITQGAGSPYDKALKQTAQHFGPKIYFPPTPLVPGLAYGLADRQSFSEQEPLSGEGATQEPASVGGPPPDAGQIAVANLTAARALRQEQLEGIQHQANVHAAQTNVTLQKTSQAAAVLSNVNKIRQTVRTIQQLQPKPYINTYGPQPYRNPFESKDTGGGPVHPTSYQGSPPPSGSFGPRESMDVGDTEKTRTFSSGVTPPSSPGKSKKPTFPPDAEPPSSPPTDSGESPTFQSQGESQNPVAE